jgi:hypothetical protein
MATTTLKFDAATKRDDQSLSGAAARGKFLFVAPDEGASIVRLRHHDASRNYRAQSSSPSLILCQSLDRQKMRST